MSAGDRFENDVVDALRLLPRADVTPHVKIAGKDVDALLVREVPLLGTVRVAVECKDHHRPLTRKFVSGVVADYQPLLTRGDVDAVYLVTSSGIVANARDVLPPHITHWRLDDLLEEVLAPKSLLADMVNQYDASGLDRYYAATSVFEVDVADVSARYAFFYNPFVEFALAAPDPEDIGAVLESWHKAVPRHEADRLPALYDERTYHEVVRARLTDVRTKLKPIVDAWIADDECRHGLALVGSYGSGKSSFARHLAWDYARRFQRGGTTRIPLLVELRDFGAHQNIEALITDRLVNHHRLAISFSAFSYLNTAGRFLLILDGFDEMKQAMNRDAILFSFNELNKLVTPRSKVVLCGRPSIFVSDQEQSEIMSASGSVYFENAARYIQLNVAPLETDQIAGTVVAYARALGDEEAAAVAKRAKELDREIVSNQELRALLARPVHISMLVRAMPSINRPLAKLRRADLYAHFIDRTIERDVVRSMSGQDASRYTTEDRRKFARSVAVEMYRVGQDGAIRTPQLPNSLFAPFKRRSETLDEVRRSLVAACFLERRHDMLLFGHKSYGEFLVAEAVVEIIDDARSSDALHVGLNPEMLSFIAELMTVTRWHTVLANARINEGLLTGFLRLAQPRGAHHDVEIDMHDFARVVLGESGLTLLAQRAQTFGDGLRMSIADYGHSTALAGGEFTAGLRTLMQSIITLDCGTPSVKAFLALRASGAMDDRILRRLIGARRFEQWVARGWTNDPNLDE